jgi:hypothetical protein
MRSKISLRTVAATAVLAASIIALTGCATPYDAASKLALQGLADQLQKLKTNTADAGGATGANARAAQITAGNLGTFLSDTATPPPTTSGEFGYAIYDVTVVHNTTHLAAVVWAGGESGGGFTGDQANVYVCVTALAWPSDLTQKSLLRDVPCPKDVTTLIRNREGKVHVKLSDVPGYD